MFRLVLDRKVGDAIHELGTQGITDFGSRGLHSRMNLFAAFGVGCGNDTSPQNGCCAATEVAIQEPSETKAYSRFRAAAQQTCRDLILSKADALCAPVLGS